MTRGPVPCSSYYLKQNHVAAFPSGERNFHIFYYLIAGALPGERLHLHLLDKTMYRYLGPHGTTSTRPNEGCDNNSLQFDQLKIALKTTSFQNDIVTNFFLCSFLVIIVLLHLSIFPSNFHLFHMHSIAVHT